MNDTQRDPCPSDETLAAHAEGRIEAAVRARFDAHLADCEDCRAALRDVVWALEEGAARAAPAGLAERMLAGLPAAAIRPQGEDGMSRFLQFVGAAAAILIVAIGLVLWAGDLGSRGGGTVGLGEATLPLAKPAAAGEVAAPPRPADLGGANRYLAHLSTDKPLYRPGERLFGRAVVLDAFRHTPFAEPASQGLLQVRSARGEVVYGQPVRIADGVAAFGWAIPPDQAGGAYTLVASFPGAGLPEATLDVDVRRYRIPRLKTDLQFLRKAYGPGDRVIATLEVRRAQGTIPAGAAVTAMARVDGEEIARQTLTLDERGRCRAEFALHDVMKKGVGTLAFSIRDGGIQETAAKTIPIVLNQVALRFFPEGGDLVAGVPCGLYFEARNTRDEPADVAGRIVDEAGREVVRFASHHEGRGLCAFVPRVGARYRAILEAPAGIEDAVDLPPVQATGFGLRARGGAYDDEGPIDVAIASPRPAAATVALFVRERELDVQTVRLPAGRAVAVRLEPGERVYGVLRVTVFDAQGQPQAERLVFRCPPTGLRVELTPEADSTVPGGKVRVAVRTTDVLGRPVPAVLGLAVSDDAVLATVEPRERAPRLPVQALLGAEVRELKDAQTYLGDDATNVDLLLATQGWRRFAFQDPTGFLAQHGESARRALAQRLPQPPLPSVVDAWGMWDAREDAEDPVGGEGRFPAPGAAPAPKKAGALDVPPAPPAGPPVPQAPPEAEPRPGAEEDAEFEEVEELGKRRLDVGRRAYKPQTWMRVYAHESRPDRVPGVRTDFTETVYWNAALKTDAEGRATIEFDAADAITLLRVRADAFSAQGALAEAETTVAVRRPFTVEPKFPLEVSAGDLIDMPLVLVNGTDVPLEASIEADVGAGLFLRKGPSGPIRVPARGSVRRGLVLAVGQTRGQAELRLRAVASPVGAGGGAYTDDVTRTIRIVPAGFPVEQDFGGVLERIVEHEVTVPESILPGSVVTETAVYPTPLASLTEALKALLREPGGCFEQTSSTNYPNVMAMQYMQEHSGVDPALVRRARELLERGYKRLVSFECKEHGYEWFGGDPGHEALTAYGVLEFHDMAKVMDVDAAMLERTRGWLLARRDGKGGFRRNARALDTFGRAPDAITNAYILWALVEAEQGGLEREIAALKKASATSDDTYLLALAANVLWASGEREAARALLARLAAKQADDGHVAGAETSITRSGGEGLLIETTALAVLAWLPVPEHTRQVEGAMRWLAQRCKAGRFGSTQSTVLALKAITAYDKARARPRRPGKVTLFLDGAPLHEVHFPADQEGPIVLPDLAQTLVPGTHTVRLTMEGGADMPHAFRVRYSALVPPTSPDGCVAVETSLDRDEVAEGETVSVSVSVRNTSSEGQPMAVAIVGLPGGLEARAEQLKELVRAKKVAAFETRGREVVLYWRDLAPGAHHAFGIDCVAAVPGTYTGPASRAYLYYTDEHKVWAPGLRVHIRAE